LGEGKKGSHPFQDGKGSSRPFEKGGPFLCAWRRREKKEGASTGLLEKRKRRGTTRFERKNVVCSPRRGKRGKKKLVPEIEVPRKGRKRSLTKSGVWGREKGF